MQATHRIDFKGLKLMESLQFLCEQLKLLGIPYEFGEWTSELSYPYFVGELTEDPIETEDGAETSTFILTGTHKGNYLDLVKIKEKVKKHFDPIYGLRDSTEAGSIAIFWDGAFFVPTNVADLKRIQINLKIKEWKGR